jgi:hypothetical protein
MKMLANVLLHTLRNIIKNHRILRSEKYQELKNVYPNIPSYLIHGVSRDATTRVSSLKGIGLDNTLERSSMRSLNA